MLIEDFQRIVTAFADSPADMDLGRGKLLVQVRDELIEATLRQEGGELTIEENDQRFSPASWIITRLARLPLLADRILSYVHEPDSFVSPAGRLIDQPDYVTQTDDVPQSDAARSALGVLGRSVAGVTSVLYLTSDAGEGKTTLISHLARGQAEEYKAKRSKWLLVPIPLGGRAFLRFDDVVVAALVNRLRFQLLYFEAFLELVRMGAVVPAFDGFEEMIVESSSGEALSALGTLVGGLRSSGTLLIAARKAYFEYGGLRTQAKLLESIGSNAVAFARLALDRWNREQFLAYAQKRQLGDGEGLYRLVADRLTEQHPLLTRAVLVKRLVDVAGSASSLPALLAEIGNRPQDYFFRFVNTLVEREASEKWLDKSGDPAQPLLTVEEHHELLGMVAQELWLGNVESLRLDVIGAVAEVFAEAHSKPPAVARQIQERLKHHSLLVAAGSGGSSLAFDHEDFRIFYLGEALGRLLVERATGELKSLLQVGSLPRAATAEAVLYFRRHDGDDEILTTLQRLSDSEPPTSYVREGCGSISFELLDGRHAGAEAVQLSGMAFPVESLRARKLDHLRVVQATFQATSLLETSLTRCHFTQCRFERLEVESPGKIEATMEACRIVSLFDVDSDAQLFDPRLIRLTLSECGFEFAEPEPPASEMPTLEDDLRLAERGLRTFSRATEANSSFMRMRLGNRGNRFVDKIVPELVRAGVLQRVHYHGSGVQERYRMAVPMSAIQEALANCGGSYAEFLLIVKS
jgi:hypothetical protein